MTFIMFCYYVITAIVVFFLGWNFFKLKDVNKDDVIRYSRISILTQIAET